MTNDRVSCGTPARAQHAGDGHRTGAKRGPAAVRASVWGGGGRVAVLPARRCGVGCLVERFAVRLARLGRSI